MKQPKHSIMIRGLKGDVKYGFYANNRIAIQYISDAGPLAILTVNLPDANLEEGEFCIKNWSENELVAKVAMKTGHFEDTGKRVSTGFVEAQIWKFKDNFKEQNATKN